MIYMLKVYALVATVVFVPAGFIILALFAVSEVKQYARARQAMQRTTAGPGSALSGRARAA